MYTFNEPYTCDQPQEIRDDMHELASAMSHEQLVNLVSTYFSTDQLRELIDDHMMGRV